MAKPRVLLLPLYNAVFNLSTLKSCRPFIFLQTILFFEFKLTIPTPYNKILTQLVYKYFFILGQLLSPLKIEIIFLAIVL